MDAYMQMLGIVVDAMTEEFGVIQTFQNNLNLFGIPGPKKLTNNNSTTPYVFLSDDAFALKTYLMKPYRQRGLTVEKRIYNYRHSRAHRISENLFGIICNRWLLFRAPILLPPNSVELIALAKLILHIS